MLHGLKCWTVDKKIKQKMREVEVRMIRWTSGVTREDWIRNEYVRGSKGVNKMRKDRLKWPHVMRREKFSLKKTVMK